MMTAQARWLPTMLLHTPTAAPSTYDPRRTARPIRLPAHWAFYVLIAVVSLAVLMYSVVEQIYDNNFYVLWEATALLAGDQPYRDFYLIGWPLLTAVSTAVQWLVGYRLIGEFALHWIFIAASLVLGFHLALRLSGSLAASLATTAVGIVLLFSTPTFQFPKLFFYPIAILVAWWYMDRPDVRRGAIVGLVTGIAFLYRHDHGVYIGVAAVLAFVLVRLVDPATRGWRRAAAEAAAFTATAALVLAPWALLVSRGEGLADYVATRAEWGRTWNTGESPFASLLAINPTSLRSGDPERVLSQDAALDWLLQVTLLLPLLTLGASAADLIGRRRRRLPIPPDTVRALLASALVLIVANQLFRERGYFSSVLPLSIAFGARLLAGAPRTRPSSDTYRLLRQVAAVTVCLFTAVAAVAAANWDLFSSGELEEVPNAYRQLLASPPIDGYQSAAEARQLSPSAWADADDDDKLAVILRYVHDCTRDGDRLFVTGSTPYQVGYYAARPIAGGHLQWHHRWRSDPAHEAQSLALLERQSVPFAVATHDPVLQDLEAYPRIRAWVDANYTEIPGSDGRLLVSRHRAPTGTFGALGFPCFQ